MDRSSLPDVIGRHIPLPLPVPDWSKPIILALLLLSVASGARAHLARGRARRLETEQGILTAQRDSMQLALVPEIPDQLGALGVSVAYRPADGPAAGGDFYDAFVLAGARVAIILGDVSGHGPSALAHANRMRHTLRAYLEAGFAPRAALKLAGNVAGPAGEDLFTTVVIGVHDPDAATLTYASAGHPAPLLRGPVDHVPLTSASPALGWGAVTGRRQTTVPFATGASACFFSDGLTEARTGDELLGRERLTEMFAELPPGGPAVALLDAVRAQAQELRDDMAACAIHARSGCSAREFCTEEFEVDANQLAAGQAHRFLVGCDVPHDEVQPLVDGARAVAAQSGAALLVVERPTSSATERAPARVRVDAARPPVLTYGALGAAAAGVGIGSPRPAEGRPVGASADR